MRIDIPDSAIEIQRLVDPERVQFLMPNDEWRGYVAHYYPDKEPSPGLGYAHEAEVPGFCVPAYRAGTVRGTWTNSDTIQWFNTDKRYRRMVIVTPDCEPGLAYVTWTGALLSDS